MSLIDHSRRQGSWLLLTVVAGLLTACDSAAPTTDAGPTPQASSSGSAATGPVAPLAAIAPPPSGPLEIKDASPAAQAVLAAARKTAESGSFRFRLNAEFSGATNGQKAAIVSSGDSESATRSRVLTSVTLPQHYATTETVTYDGVTVTRSGQEAWKPVANAPPSGPQAYLGYLSKSTGFADAGPGDRNGLTTEKYTASLAAGAGDAASPAAIVMYVDQASGRLVAEDIDPRSGALGSGLIQIDFSDFGAAIKVSPPTPAP
ncbi:MAG: hypothetical protein ACR2MY_10720 [Candidatus Dormibacteria bacterium]